jgi:hypothetical protein
MKHYRSKLYEKSNFKTTQDLHYIKPQAHSNVCGKSAHLSNTS